MAIASPCISVCKMDEVSGMCLGCKRTVQEIAMWLYYSENEKEQVIKSLEKRAQPQPPC